MKGNTMREKVHIFCALGASLFHFKISDILIPDNEK